MSNFVFRKFSLVFSKNKNKLFIIFSILFVFAAMYHAAAIFIKLNDSPAWRNIFFVLINLFCVYGLLIRRKYFIYFFGLLLVQQLYSHGSSLINSLEADGKLDWRNIAVLSILPFIFICLIADRKQPEQNNTVK